jgi:hypothetical protein
MSTRFERFKDALDESLTKKAMEGRRMIAKRNRSGMFFRFTGCALALLLSTTLLTSKLSWAQNSVSQQSVPLSSYYNVNGISTDNTSSIGNGGFDNDGSAYSENAMQAACTTPTSATSPTYACSGTYPTLSFAESSSATVTFDFGAANTTNSVTGAGLGPIALPSGEFTELQMLGAGVNGSQAGQKIVVNYTDGSSDTISQTFGDWFSGKCEDAAESTALIPAYRLETVSGVVQQDTRQFYVCLYNIAIDPTRTVSTLVLPDNRNVVIMSATLVAIPGFATAAGTPSATTVSAGSSLTVPVSAISEAGYANGTVTFACAVSPAIQPYQAATPPACTFSPTTASVNVGAPGTSTLTFTPASPATTAKANQNLRWMYALWLPISGLALVGVGANSRTARRRRLLGLLLLGFLLAGVVMTPACVTYTHLGNVGTPPGQYTIIVTGMDQNGNAQLGTGGSVTVTVQ